MLAVMLRQFNGERIDFFQQMVLEQLDIYIQKNEVFTSASHQIKNQLKMYPAPKYRS